MKKSMKLALLGVLVCAFVFSFAMFLAPLNVAVKASEVQAYAGFEMVEGASIRVGETANDEESGIRFTAALGITDDSDAKLEYNYSVAIIPAAYLDVYASDLTADENGYVDYVGVLKEKNPNLADMRALPYKNAKDGKYYVRGSLTNVKYENHNVEFLGIAYYTIDGSEHRYYATFDVEKNARSIGHVASVALNRDTELVHYSAYLTSRVLMAYEDYLGNAEYSGAKTLVIPGGYDHGVKSVTNGTSMTLNLPPLYDANGESGKKYVYADTLGFDVYYYSTNEEVATVDDSGKITVKADSGEATIKCKIIGKNATLVTIKARKALPNSLLVEDFGEESALTQMLEYKGGHSFSNGSGGTTTTGNKYEGVVENSEQGIEADKFYSKWHNSIELGGETRQGVVETVTTTGGYYNTGKFTFKTSWTKAKLLNTLSKMSNTDYFYINIYLEDTVNHNFSTNNKNLGVIYGGKWNHIKLTKANISDTNSFWSKNAVTGATSDPLDRFATSMAIETISGTTATCALFNLVNVTTPLKIYIDTFGVAMNEENTLLDFHDASDATLTSISANKFINNNYKGTWMHYFEGRYGVISRLDNSGYGSIAVRLGRTKAELEAMTFNQVVISLYVVKEGSETVKINGQTINTGKWQEIIIDDAYLEAGKISANVTTWAQFKNWFASDGEKIPIPSGQSWVAQNNNLLLNGTSGCTIYIDKISCRNINNG